MVDVGQRGVDTVRAVWGKWVACLGMAWKCCWTRCSFDGRISNYLLD